MENFCVLRINKNHKNLHMNVHSILYTIYPNKIPMSQKVETP